MGTNKKELLALLEKHLESRLIIINEFKEAEEQIKNADDKVLLSSIRASSANLIPLLEIVITAIKEGPSDDHRDTYV